MKFPLYYKIGFLGLLIFFIGLALKWIRLAIEGVMYYKYSALYSFHLNFNSLNLLISGITLLVLWRTLYWVKRYTAATQKILENETIPNVEVNMRYYKRERSTCLWFSNPSGVPAFVTLLVKEVDTGNVAYEKTLRIPPDIPHIIHFRQTAPIGLYKDQIIKNKTEVIIDVECRSAKKNTIGINEYQKSYRFNAVNQEWDETTWSYPDPPFPLSEKNIRA